MAMRCQVLLLATWSSAVLLIICLCPDYILISYLDEIPENMPAGTVIGVLNTTDPDNANTITQVCFIS